MSELVSDEKDVVMVPAVIGLLVARSLMSQKLTNNIVVNIELVIKHHEELGWV